MRIAHSGLALLILLAAPQALRAQCRPVWSDEVPSLAAGAVTTIATLDLGPAQRHYAGGFDSVNGTAAHRIARYAGSAWMPLGDSPPSAPTGPPSPLVGGIPTGVSAPLRFWTGESWEAIPDAPAAVLSLARAPEGGVLAGAPALTIDDFTCFVRHFAQGCR